MTAIQGLRTGAAWALMAVSSLALGAEPTAHEPITAVYKAQELSFQYRSSGRYLPCHELEHRVAVILVAVGARDDISVKARNCEFMLDTDNNIDPMTGRDTMDPFGRDDRFGTSSRFGRTNDRRDQYASVRVQLMMPTKVTPQLLKEIEKDKSRRELVSRVTGNMAAAFNDPIIFEARRQEVTLSQRTIKLRAEDCELLDQMSNSVFRKLDVKVLRRSFSCGPRDSASSRIPPQLVAEALLPTGSLLPMPDPEKEKEKESGAAEQPASPPAETAAEPPPQQ